jgi:hypothetical protein
MSATAGGSGQDSVRVNVGGSIAAPELAGHDAMHPHALEHAGAERVSVAPLGVMVIPVDAEQRKHCV